MAPLLHNVVPELALNRIKLRFNLKIVLKKFHSSISGLHNLNTSKQTIMDQEIISITCRQCKTTFPFKKIVLHVINKPDCRKTYTEAQMESLRMHSKEITAAKKRAKMRKQYDPARRAIKHYKKYDRFQRSQKYKKECKKVAEYYQKCKKDKDKRESD